MPSRRKVVRIVGQFGFRAAPGNSEAVLECGCKVDIQADQEYATCSHCEDEPSTPENRREECEMLGRVCRELAKGDDVEIPDEIAHDPGRLKLFIISMLATQVLESPIHRQIDELLLPCFILPADQKK